MDITAKQVDELIRSRRAIFPATFIDKVIPESTIRRILENANWAPTHKRTEPWRFKVFRGEARKRLSRYLAEYYRRNTPPEMFSQKKYEKNMAKPMQSSCIIAICMQRDPQETVPEWEEIASVACAVQNMWLSCTALGIGCYWSSPKAMIEGEEFLKLAEGERCLGIFYMGYHDMPQIPGKRGPIEEKTVWWEE